MSEAARTQTGKNKLNRVQFLAIVGPQSVFPKPARKEAR